MGCVTWPPQAAAAPPIVHPAAACHRLAVKNTEPATDEGIMSVTGRRVEPADAADDDPYSNSRTSLLKVDVQPSLCSTLCSALWNVF